MAGLLGLLEGVEFQDGEEEAPFQEGEFQDGQEEALFQEGESETEYK